MRERLAKLKARAIERVLDELEMEAEKKNMAMLKVELVERLSRVYGEELRRADLVDPNKARYVRDSMLACAEEALGGKGWTVLENCSPATSMRRSGGRGMRGTASDAATANPAVSPSPSSILRSRVTELEEEVSVGKALVSQLLYRVGQLEETWAPFLPRKRTQAAVMVATAVVVTLRVECAAANGFS